MHVCVDRTANLRCAIREWFAYCSLRTKICWFFARTQRELDVPGIPCLPQLHRKLMNRTPNTCRVRTVQCVSGALVYTRFKEKFAFTFFSECALNLLTEKKRIANSVYTRVCWWFVVCPFIHESCTSRIQITYHAYKLRITHTKGASTLPTTCRSTCQSTLSLHKCRLKSTCRSTNHSKLKIYHYRSYIPVFFSSTCVFY